LFEKPSSRRLRMSGESMTATESTTMRTKTLNRAMATLLLLVSALALAGCWTTPTANVQPRGEARVIQSSIPVESVKHRVTVQSIDADRRVIVLNFSDGTTATYRPGPQAANIHQIRAGDKVQATVAQELTIYVSKNGQVPGTGGKPEALEADAKVLRVDPSYRLLALQYPNGQTQTFKVGLGVKLLEMEPGDIVAIRTMELIALREEKP
jgi:hypothetical protein